MANRAQLAIEITSDASDAAKGFDDVTSSARDMSREVEKVGKNVDGTTSKLNTVADASDNMASSSSQAAGGLGDLGGALTLLPGPLAGVGGAMETVAPAIMGVTGAADLLNLATSSTIVVQTKARISAIAHGAASLAQAAITRTVAASQWALNAAMAANPIGLVVIAVIALVAGFILLYRRSERFRTIVQAVGRAGAAAIGWVVDVAQDLAKWVGENIPRAFGTAKDLAVRYLLLITTPQRKLLDIVKSIVDWVKEKLPAAFGVAKRAASAIGDALLAPFRALRDMIRDVVDWISKIHIPDLGGLGDLAGGIAGGLGFRLDESHFANQATTVPVTADTYNINVTGAVDPESTARQIITLVNDSRRRRGLAPAL